MKFMKKISLRKLASTALLLILALGSSHPVLADRIDMAKLQPAERIEVVKMKQQGKTDDQIREILQQRKEEAQKAQIEPLRNK
jgi:hypothetical protein